MGNGADRILDEKLLPESDCSLIEILQASECKTNYPCKVVFSVGDKPWIYYGSEHDNDNTFGYWEVPTQKQNVVRWGANPFLPSEWIGIQLHTAMVVSRELVVSNPQILSGVPVLRGTRFSVARVLVELSEDVSISELADDYELDLGVLRRLLQCLSMYLDRPTY